MKFIAEEKCVKVDGRTVFRDGIRYLGYSASAVSFRMKGTKACVDIVSDPEDFLLEERAWVAVYINGEKEPKMRVALGEKKQRIILFESETEETVLIKLMKYTEPEYAICGVAGFEIDGELLPPPERKKRQVQVIGDSITCGYGVEGSIEEMVHRTVTENPAKAYAYLAARELNAELEVVAWSGKGVISGYIGEEEEPVKDDSWLVPMFYQYTDAGLEKQYFHKPQEEWERWEPEKLAPDLVMLHLGTNDSSYTRESAERKEEFLEGYFAFLEEIHEKNPDAKILCMLGIMDQRLCSTVSGAVQKFQQAYPAAGILYLQLNEQLEEDGLGTFWHPTYDTNKKAAGLVAEAAKKLMGW